MKRFRLSTLMLLIVMVAVGMAFVVQDQRVSAWATADRIAFDRLKVELWEASLKEDNRSRKANLPTRPTNLTVLPPKSHPENVRMPTTPINPYNRLFK